MYTITKQWSAGGRYVIFQYLRTYIIWLRLSVIITHSGRSTAGVSFGICQAIARLSGRSTIFHTIRSTNTVSRSVICWWCYTHTNCETFLCDTLYTRPLYSVNKLRILCKRQQNTIFSYGDVGLQGHCLCYPLFTAALPFGCLPARTRQTSAAATAVAATSRIATTALMPPVCVTLFRERAIASVSFKRAQLFVVRALERYPHAYTHFSRAHRTYQTPPVVTLKTGANKIYTMPTTNNIMSWNAHSQFLRHQTNEKKSAPLDRKLHLPLLWNIGNCVESAPTPTMSPPT